jgi:hypothetical protein
VGGWVRGTRTAAEGSDHGYDLLQKVGAHGPLGGVLLVELLAQYLLHLLQEFAHHTLNICEICGYECLRNNIIIKNKIKNVKWNV